MVRFTCDEPACARVYHQEPAYLNHLRKHRKPNQASFGDDMADEIVNNGGEYLKVLKPARKQRA